MNEMTGTGAVPARGDYSDGVPRRGAIQVTKPR
jgi:hypothetical protein